MIDSLKDKLLILKLRQGDTEAFGEIYDRYATKIYRFIFFKISSVEEAEDLTSEVFLKLWQYLNQQETELHNLKAFIYQIARNQVIDHYRTKARKETISLDSENISEKDFLDFSGQKQLKIFERIDSEQQFDEIKSALTRLKEEYQEVLLLKYVEDFSTTEIAKIINKSNGATRVLIHRALIALKEVFNPNNQNDKPGANK